MLWGGATEYMSSGKFRGTSAGKSTEVPTVFNCSGFPVQARLSDSAKTAAAAFDILAVTFSGPAFFKAGAQRVPRILGPDRSGKQGPQGFESVRTRETPLIRPVGHLLPRPGGEGTSRKSENTRR